MKKIELKENLVKVYTILRSCSVELVSNAWMKEYIEKCKYEEFL